MKVLLPLILIVGFAFHFQTQAQGLNKDNFRDEGPSRKPVADQRYMRGRILIEDELSKPQKPEVENIDIVAVSPDKARVLLDNEFVRIIEYSIKPGEKDNLHTHPSGSSYVISGGLLRVFSENGETEDFQEIKGNTEWSGYQAKHSVQNIGKTTVTILLTEVKSVK